LEARMSRRRCIGAIAGLALLAAAPLFATPPVSMAVFVPGVAAGSPIYEQLVSGARKAAAEFPSLTLKVVEGGFNQAEWPERVTSLAAAGTYDYILTSNPSLPSICAEVGRSFPKQKFICVDGYLPGNPQLYTLMYNQVEQGYLAGYFAALVTKSSMKGATPDLKVGVIVAQEYPALTKEILPGFRQGCAAADPRVTVDYRVIGNWFDAGRGADLANSMMDGGVDIILSIAGGAGQGVIKAAQQRGRYVQYFDSNEYRLSPGTIIGCATIAQERAVYEAVQKAMQGTLPLGQADVVDARGGYVAFADNDPLYLQNVPPAIRAAMAELTKRLTTGALELPVPRME
jgi:riboflavin transport system substrate-binding protein